MDWSQILGLAINGIGVLMVVQVLKNYVMPWLKTTYPWALPIIALGAGSAMTWLTLLLTDLIGVPIDLSAITGILTGAMAVVGYGVARNTPLVSQKKFVIPKRGGGFRGSSLLLCFLVPVFLFLLTGPLQAQTFENDFALGGGGFFGEEEQTFNRDSLFVAVHWSGIELPLNAGSGLGIEFMFPEQPGVQAVYTLWSLNRINVSDGFYTGTDMRISKETNPDFAMRLVVGVKIAITQNNSKLSIEIYTLEDERPIAFAVLYSF